MAKAVALSLSLPGVEGVEVNINYNPSTLRITSVDWIIPQNGVVARARVWRNDQLVLDRTVAGPSNGTVTVPGINRVVQVTEDGQVFYDLPPEIKYEINLETIG